MHNMIIPLQNMDEIHLWENRPFSGAIHEPKRCNKDIKVPIKKKVKRNRTAFTTNQLRSLEFLFAQNRYISSERRRKISKTLNLGDRSVKIWFQNRRMKEKRESSESSRVESDFSSETFACCERSPPSTASIESHEPHQNESIMNDTFAAESRQYQVPYFYAQNTNYHQIPNVHVSDYNTLQANGTQFYNDNNIYPIQYYPPNGGNCINDYNNYYQYQQESSLHNNYWSLNNFASYYLNNEGV